MANVRVMLHLALDATLETHKAIIMAVYSRIQQKVSF